jgi:hypothetical protein
MGHRLSELSGTNLKSIFDAAFMDCHLDSDGDCVVDDALKVVVIPQPKKDILKLLALFGVNASREQALEFCNRFNDGLVMCRAAVSDTQDSDGEWRITFDHDRVTFEDETLESKSIVMLVRKFANVVRGGIAKTDRDDLF